jgi:pimeloyl-ACP methyl ester carboxylesterase
MNIMKKLLVTNCLFITATIIIYAQQLPTAINLQEEVELGGVKQWIQVRGADTANPILLFLHGGPGFPEMPFSYFDSKELENHFIVVNWDQRGCGKSYSPNFSNETLTLEQILSDTKELVIFLKNEYSKDKIFLMGHSWGSILGMYTVAKHPEEFYAYIGMGQVINSNEGELISYQYALRKAKEAKDTTSVNQLNSIGLPPYEGYQSTSIQRNILGNYGGVFGGELTYPEIIRIINHSPDYTQKDKQNILPVFIQVNNQMWEQVTSIDLTGIKRIKVPVYFFLGKHDYSVPFEIAERYLNKLKAPYKEIVWFENSGHYPNLEEPEKYQDVLINVVLKNTPFK